MFEADSDPYEIVDAKLLHHRTFGDFGTDFDRLVVEVPEDLVDVVYGDVLLYLDPSSEPSCFLDHRVSAGVADQRLADHSVLYSRLDLGIAYVVAQEMGHHQFYPVLIRRFDDGVCVLQVGGDGLFQQDLFSRSSGILHSLTGVEAFANVENLKKAGIKICLLRRAFNQREGLDRKDDTLPQRFFSEPEPEGPAAGEVVNLDIMLDDYYRLWGFDGKGRILPDTLEKAGLSDVKETLYE